MPVNPEGTNAGDELLAALDQVELEPTTEVEDEEDAGPEAEDDGEASEDDELDAEAEEEEAEDGEDDGTKLYPVKINGQEEQVTLSELQAGYMKDADYRRKTADIADTRKRVEAAEAEYTGGLKKLDEQLELVTTFIANQMNYDEAEMDKLAADKPAEYVALKRQMEKQGSALQAAHNHLMRVRQAAADAANKKLSEFRDAESAKLAEVAPEFKKAETIDRLHSYLKDTYGLSKEEIASVVDHRFALIADKARRFDAIKAKAALKDKQVKTTPARFQKGGAAAGRNEASKAKADAFKKVMSSGKVDSLARMF